MAVAAPIVTDAPTATTSGNAGPPLAGMVADKDLGDAAHGPEQASMAVTTVLRGAPAGAEPVPIVEHAAAALDEGAAAEQSLGVAARPPAET
eukprot:3362610-Heterocapsa_arctica.AAC.1